MRSLLCIFLLAWSVSAIAGELSSSLENSHERLFKFLRREGILHPARKLVHLSYVCSLRAAGKSMPVIDLREIVPGAAVPRGVNRILVLSSNGNVASDISYSTERPLECRGAKLIIAGKLAVDNLEPSGNVLFFSSEGRFLRAENMDAQDLWLPSTQD